MKDRVFLIGGSGFIGKNLVRHLSPYFDIIVFDKYIDNDFFRRYPRVLTQKMDLIRDKIPLSYGCPEYIINLASIVTAERDLSLFDELISSNLKILLNIFERFSGCDALKLIIQFGSSEEYGSVGSPFVETMREQPESPYALVKQLTTNTAIMLNHNYGFPIMVVRPGNLYGPGQNSSKFIPYIISKLRENQPLEVTPCEQKRDFIHVDDFCKAIIKLLGNHKKCIGEIVNVSSGKSISLKSIIEKFKTEFKSTSIVNYGAIPYRENEAMDLCCDITKLNSLIKI